MEFRKQKQANASPTRACTLLAATGELARQIGELANSAPQTLRFACLETFSSLLVAEVLRRFVAKYGKVEILLYEGDQVQLQEWLVNGEVELVITDDIGSSFANGRTTRICRIPSHTLLPGGDPLAKQSAVHRGTGNATASITRPPPDISLRDKFFYAQATSPRVAFRAQSYETVRSAGFGVALLQMKPSKYSTPDGPGWVRRLLIDSFAAPTLTVADMYGDHNPQLGGFQIDIVNDLFHEAGPKRFRGCNARTCPNTFGCALGPLKKPCGQDWFSGSLCV